MSVGVNNKTKCYPVPRYSARPILISSVIKVRELVVGWGPYISHKHKFVYYDVPKAACTTVKLWIADADGIAVKSSIHSTDIPRISYRKAASKYKDYFHFSFVRNPWDRLVSCYYNKICDPADKGIRNAVIVDGEYKGFTGRYGKGYFKHMTFTDFVHFICDIPDWMCDAHFRSQDTFLNMGAMDFVGRFEDFRLDFRYVMEEVGAADSATKFLSQKSMASSYEGGYRALYDDETQALVARKYAREIERFNYTF